MVPEQGRALVDGLYEKLIRSPKFHARTHRDDNLTKNLRDFVRAYGSSPPPDLVDRVKGGPAHFLKRRLEDCFREDLSFWRLPGQYMLELASAQEGLVVSHLSNVLEDPATRFWFHQCARLGQKRRTLITFSEPLFFFSKKLNTYLRFLDLNDNEPLEGREADIRKNARVNILRKLRAIGLDPSRSNQLFDALDPVPVRHYLPAGDAYAASVIRRWFRDKELTPPSRRESQRISGTDHPNLNLIVLASRRTNKELVYFRQRNPDVELDLTENGISHKGQELRDTITPAQGASRVHVIVTNWVFEADNVYTIIVSNHSRAVGRVANLMVSGDLDPAKLVHDRLFPTKVQLAFEVQLRTHEFHADDPKLVIGPITYD